MKSIFIGQFIHTDFFHLISNLYGLYSLSDVELKLGPKKFFSLILFLLIFNTILEVLLHKLINVPCSIGFSGILYGVLTFEIITNNNSFDYKLLAAIILNMIATKFIKKNTSLEGHIIGGISGVIGGIIYKKIFNHNL
jgi:membrane associated rhomboid family serine protease